MGKLCVFLFFVALGIADCNAQQRGLSFEQNKKNAQAYMREKHGEGWINFGDARSTYLSILRRAGDDSSYKQELKRVQDYTRSEWEKSKPILNSSKHKSMQSMLDHAAKSYKEHNKSALDFMVGNYSGETSKQTKMYAKAQQLFNDYINKSDLPEATKQSILANENSRFQQNMGNRPGADKMQTNLDIGIMAATPVRDVSAGLFTAGAVMLFPPSAGVVVGAGMTGLAASNAVKNFENAGTYEEKIESLKSARAQTQKKIEAMNIQIANASGGADAVKAHEMNRYITELKDFDKKLQNSIVKGEEAKDAATQKAWISTAEVGLALAGAGYSRAGSSANLKVPKQNKPGADLSSQKAPQAPHNSSKKVSVAGNAGPKISKSQAPKPKESNGEYKAGDKINVSDLSPEMQANFGSVKQVTVMGKTPSGKLMLSTNNRGLQSKTYLANPNGIGKSSGYSVGDKINVSDLSPNMRANFGTAEQVTVMGKTPSGKLMLSTNNRGLQSKTYLANPNGINPSGATPKPSYKKGDSISYEQLSDSAKLDANPSTTYEIANITSKGNYLLIPKSKPGQPYNHNNNGLKVNPSEITSPSNSSGATNAGSSSTSYADSSSASASNVSWGSLSSQAPNASSKTVTPSSPASPNPSSAH